MLPARYYQLIYLIVVLILTLACLRKYKYYSQSRLYGNENQSYVPVIVSALLFSLFIGFRPVDLYYFVDMYDYDMEWYNKADPDYRWNWNTDNILFDNLFGILSGAGLPSRFLFVSLALIYFIGIALACCAFFPKDNLCSFLVYLAAFSTFPYATNGLKAGVAATLFLLSVSLHEKRRYLGMALFLIFSLGFHHSMILPVTAFLVCIIVKNPRIFRLFWVFCFFCALFRISFFQHLFAGLVNEQGASYLLGDGAHVKSSILGGFRIDFILYSIVPLIIGEVATSKKKIHSKNYLFVLNLYTLINSIWLLCMYAEYTNRIAYLSWLLSPIVLIYPFLRENWGKYQYRTFGQISLGNLAFTIVLFLMNHG